jgi:hypothetical protein
MQEYDIRVQKFKAADNADDALRFAKELGVSCRLLQHSPMSQFVL